MTTTIYESIIHAAEVWSADEASNGLRPTSSFAEINEFVTESVIDRVTSELAPIIVNSEDPVSSNGSTPHYNAVMGIPIIADQQIKACLILSIACPDDAMAAFEIWSRNDRDELGLNGGVFAGLSRFASISQHVRFPRGSGLPGQSWENRDANLITGLGTSPNFMRAAGARAGGLDVGVALPVMTTEHDLNSVILLLSSKMTPIARVFEIWDVSDVAKLRLTASTGCAATAIEANAMTYIRGEGLVGRVWASGVPLVTDDLAAVERKRLSSLRADGLTSAIAIPSFVGEFLKSVFVMLN